MSGDDVDEDAWTDEHASAVLLLSEKANELPEPVREAVAHATTGKYVTQAAVRAVGTAVDTITAEHLLPLKDLVSRIRWWPAHSPPSSHIH